MSFEKELRSIAGLSIDSMSILFDMSTKEITTIEQGKAERKKQQDYRNKLCTLFSITDTWDILPSKKEQNELICSWIESEWFQTYRMRKEEGKKLLRLRQQWQLPLVQIVRASSLSQKQFIKMEEGLIPISNALLYGIASLKKITVEEVEIQIK